MSGTRPSDGCDVGTWYDHGYDMGAMEPAETWSRVGTVTGLQAVLPDWDRFSMCQTSGRLVLLD